MTTQSWAREWYRVLDAWKLIWGTLYYSLGAGIASYLGMPIDWTIFWGGLACVWLLQLSSALLDAAFDASTPLLPEKNAAEPRLARSVLTQAALACLTAGAALTVLLFANGAMNGATLVLLGASFAAALVLGVPPARLSNRGYGELLIAIWMANLTPALAYSLQAGELHRLLGLLTLPLTFLALAAMMAVGMTRYSADERAGRKTMMVRMGWQRGINLHQQFILAAFVLMGVAALMGLPWPLTWPGLLAAPIGMLQVYWMNAIASGAKPRWSLLFYTALALAGLAAYFLNLAVWVG